MTSSDTENGISRSATFAPARLRASLALAVLIVRFECGGDLAGELAGDVTAACAALRHAQFAHVGDAPVPLQVS